MPFHTQIIIDFAHISYPTHIVFCAVFLIGIAYIANLAAATSRVGGVC